MTRRLFARFGAALAALGLAGAAAPAAAHGWVRTYSVTYSVISVL